MSDLTTDLYRFGVALAIGALVGFERQSRQESEAASLAAAGGATPGREPPGAYDHGVDGGEAARAEQRVRAAIAAGESTRAAPVEALPPDAAAALEQGEFQHAAGVRTYTLVALAGALAGYAADAGQPWVFATALLVLGALFVSSYLGSFRTQGDLGLTSEVTALVVFLLGGLCASGATTQASALAVVVTVVLSMKRGLHTFARRVKKEDINAVLKFALLTIVVLPILPEEPIRIGDLLPTPEVGVPQGPEAAAPMPTPPTATEGEASGSWWRELTVSPRKIWYMVILISAVSFCGYVLSQVLGAGRGLVLTGIVGGLASSTAVSLAFSQRSRERPDLSAEFAIGILLANAIMPLRVLLVVGVIAWGLIQHLALPLLAMVAVGGVASLILHVRRDGPHEQAHVQLKNPFEIGPALKFGLLFGVVLLLAQVAQHLFGHAGLYAVALLTGLTDVDPIALATADQVARGQVDATPGAIAVALAVVANTVVKASFVATLGSPRLRRIALVAFGLMFLAAAGGIAGLVVLGLGE